MKQFNRVALVLTLLLILSAVIFVFGSSGGNTTPSSINTRGLGIAAYAELLRRNNIPVEIDRSPVIKLSKNDVLLIVEDNAKFYDWFQEDTTKNDYAKDGEEFSKEAPSQFQQSLTNHLKQGGRIMNLVMPTSREDFTPTASIQRVTTPNESESFDLQLGDEAYTLDEDSKTTELPLIVKGSEYFAYLTEESGGVYLDVADATFLRNRFIAKSDNAKLGVWLVKRFLPPGGKIVIAEASVGNQESRTALDEVGKWATAAFWQALFLGAVIVFTFNRRFGVASREITKARGAKELMGAMSLTLQRANRRDHALLILRASALDRVRKTLRLSIGLSEQDVISRMHPDAQSIMATIIRLQGQQVGAKQSIQLAQSLELHLREMEFEAKASRAPIQTG
ncbi:MAG: hypothetical protein ACKVQS_07800 [Fimbriimonadaceae bacterium]